MTDEDFQTEGPTSEGRESMTNSARDRQWGGDPGSWRAEDSPAYSGSNPLGQTEDSLAEPLAVLRCTTCNQRRDSRVEICKNCGGTTAEPDPDTPHHGGIIFMTEDVVDIPLPHDLEQRASLLTEQRVALAQEGAILHGAQTPPSADVLREQIIKQDAVERAQLREDIGARVHETMTTTGPGSSGKWEANSFGLSGRVIRGYRHWRGKR